MVAALQPRAAPGGRTPQRAAPPLSRGGEGGEEGGKRRLVGVPFALTCGGDDAAAIVVAAIAGPVLPTDAANSGATDVLGRRYSPPLAVALLLRRQLLLLLRASASASASTIVVAVIVMAVTLQ